MNKAAVLARIRDTGIVPVLRGSSTTEALAIAEALIAGGIDVIEVTMTVPGAHGLMRLLRLRYPHIVIGAGTVLDPETAETSIAEGAQFIVSPATNTATIEHCRRQEVAVLPGALTPTEIVHAWQAGGDVIKVFPASAMGGAAYLRSLKAPLPQIELIPTGGVSLATAADFLRAGAYALGVGAELCNPAAIQQGKPETITENAQRYLTIVREHRG